MEKIAHLFKSHPAEAGETYLQHLGFTLKLGASFFILSLVAVAHGLFPFLFCQESSSRMAEIAQRLEARRRG